MAFSTGDPLLDAARKTAAITSASSAQSAYETRTGDLGNTVSPNPPAPNPVVTAPPAVTPPVVTPTVTAPPPVAPPPAVVQPPAVTTTTTPQTPTDTGGGGQISDATAFNPEVLAQILASLEAQYGLSAEQLMAEGSEVGRLYQFIAANLGRMEAESLKGEQESSLGRGILRSGIHLENTANVERDFAERRASAEGEQAQQLTYINQQLAALQAQLEADRMAAAQGFGQQGLDYAAQYAATAPAAGFPGGQLAQSVGGVQHQTPSDAELNALRGSFGPANAQGVPKEQFGPVQPGSTYIPGNSLGMPTVVGPGQHVIDPALLALLAQNPAKQFVDPYYRNR